MSPPNLQSKQWCQIPWLLLSSKTVILLPLHAKHGTTAGSACEEGEAEQLHDADPILTTTSTSM